METHLPEISYRVSRVGGTNYLGGQCDRLRKQLKEGGCSRAGEGPARQKRPARPSRTDSRDGKAPALLSLQAPRTRSELRSGLSPWWVPSAEAGALAFLEAGAALVGPFFAGGFFRRSLFGWSFLGGGLLARNFLGRGLFAAAFFAGAFFTAGFLAAAFLAVVFFAGAAFFAAAFLTVFLRLSWHRRSFSQQPCRPPGSVDLEI